MRKKWCDNSPDACNSLSTRNTFYLCKADAGWSKTDGVNDVGGFKMFSILKKFLLKTKPIFVWVFWKIVNE